MYSGCGLTFWEMVQTHEILQEGVSRPKLIWIFVDKTTVNPLIAFRFSFAARKKHWSKNKRKPLSMLKFPITHESRNPENPQNVISMLKLLEKHIFLCATKF